MICLGKMITACIIAAAINTALPMGAMVDGLRNRAQSGVEQAKRVVQNMLRGVTTSAQKAVDNAARGAADAAGNPSQLLQGFGIPGGGVGGLIPGRLPPWPGSSAAPQAPPGTEPIGFGGGTAPALPLALPGYPPQRGGPPPRQGTVPIGGGWDATPAPQQGYQAQQTAPGTRPMEFGRSAAPPGYPPQRGTVPIGRGWGTTPAPKQLQRSQNMPNMRQRR
jgi:hypothetical protein